MKAQEKERTNNRIEALIAEMEELMKNREYEEPGIYYEQEAELERLAREIKDLVFSMDSERLFVDPDEEVC